MVTKKIEVQAAAYDALKKTAAKWRNHLQNVRRHKEQTARAAKKVTAIKQGKISFKRVSAVQKELDVLKSSHALGGAAIRHRDIRIKELTAENEALRALPVKLADGTMMKEMRADLENWGVVKPLPENKMNAEETKAAWQNACVTEGLNQEEIETLWNGHLEARVVQAAR